MSIKSPIFVNKHLACDCANSTYSKRIAQSGAQIHYISFSQNGMCENSAFVHLFVLSPHSTYSARDRNCYCILLGVYASSRKCRFSIQTVWIKVSLKVRAGFGFIFNDCDGCWYVYFYTVAIRSCFVVTCWIFCCEYIGASYCRNSSITIIMMQILTYGSVTYYLFRQAHSISFEADWVRRIVARIIRTKYRRHSNGCKHRYHIRILDLHSDSEFYKNRNDNSNHYIWCCVLWALFNVTAMRLIRTYDWLNGHIHSRRYSYAWILYTIF